jgi:molybdate transport system substrate-binding protein
MRRSCDFPDQDGVKLDADGIKKASRRGTTSGMRGLWMALCLVAACQKPAKTQEITVFAASSLRESFAAIGKAYETAHPGTKVVLQLAGSQELRTQLEHGARADVFASADQKHMAALEAAELVGPSRLFARNELVVVVRRGSAVGSFAELPDAGKIVLGAAEVPVGRYADQVLAKAGTDFRDRVVAHVVSREPNVRQVLAKVTLGEADAAIVYRTDARVAGLDAIEIPPETNVIAEYPIATTGAAGQAFVELVTSPEGQRILAAHGFVPVPSASR